MAQPLLRQLSPSPEPPDELPVAVIEPVPSTGFIGAAWSFLKDTSHHALLTGGFKYRLWMLSLAALAGVGVVAYSQQVVNGLQVTGMNDQVSWGLYISNFTFLVGVAAAAVMLVLPRYVLHELDFSKAVLVGEAIAVGALVMCLAFVTADMGGPQRLWHLIPGIGVFNFPSSMLTWDIIVLNGYLVLNTMIPLYLIFSRYRGREPKKKLYMPFVVLSVAWAVSIHLVTAFLYASQPGRPFWHSALLGPRFLASAFTAGPALIILVLSFIRSNSTYQIQDATIRKLALIVAGAAQINLIMLGSELFVLFYAPTAHTASAMYLFFGLHGHNALVGWIWPAIGANVLATALLSIPRIRQNMKFLLPLCVALFVAVWVEKGMGLIVPGFTPTALGEVADYHPSLVEIAVTVGIWAMGIGIATVLVRTGIAIEVGQLLLKKQEPSVAQSGTRTRPTGRLRQTEEETDEEIARKMAEELGEEMEEVEQVADEPASA